MAGVIREYEPLSAHTVFRIGGPARAYVETATAEDFLEALRAIPQSNLPFCILGAGSNVLVSDKGFPGTVIRVRGGKIAFDGNRARIGAGVPMAQAAVESLKKNLRGFEWAAGIPGTIGGSIVGNAGCFGGEMKDSLVSARVFSIASGKIEELPKEAFEFGYRDSILKRRPEIVVLDAVFEFKPGSATEGMALVRDYTRRRIKGQDIGARSAGCAFKNILWSRRDIDAGRMLARFPELAEFRDKPAIPAGFLIDRAGLKGRRVGRARISERHGNFILNAGGAAAEEVLILIGIAKECVHRKFGLLLEEEIRYVGFDQIRGPSGGARGGKCRRKVIHS